MKPTLSQIDKLKEKDIIIMFFSYIIILYIIILFSVGEKRKTRYREDLYNSKIVPGVGHRRRRDGRELYIRHGERDYP